jgi:hypothetical protein
MNKRISELVTTTDAWCDQNLPPNWTDDVDKYLPVWNEKFAELIIRECASQVNFTDLGRGMPYGDLILKHFGVEGEG